MNSRSPPLRRPAARPGHRTQHQAASRHARSRTTQPTPDHASEDPARWPGGHRGADTPDPVPNSAVKRPSAHGTAAQAAGEDRKSTRLNSSHANISYAVFCLKKKTYTVL